MSTDLFPPPAPVAPEPLPRAEPRPRIVHLEAARAFALVLGIAFHASLSFMPVFIGWAVQDVSTSGVVAAFVTVTHSFRMELFFLLAGFFGRGSLARGGWGAFVRGRLLRIALPLVVGWFLLRPLIVSGWVMGGASLRGEVDIGAGLRAGWQDLGRLPEGLLTGTHLWFLYYLLLVTAIVLLARLLVAAGGRGAARVRAAADAAARWLAEKPGGWLLPAAPTAVALGFMSIWGMDTPEQSLVPHGPVLAVYLGWFALGWMFGRQPELLSAFGRLSAGRVVLAVAAVVAVVALSGIGFDPGHPRHALARRGFDVAYAVMMWSLVSLTLGVFRACVSRPSRWVRYLADASYWLYLVHLPLVVWLQIAVAELPFHWSLKLVAVTAATLGGTLLSYEVLVRRTVLARVLGGARRPAAARP